MTTMQQASSFAGSSSSSNRSSVRSPLRHVSGNERRLSFQSLKSKSTPDVPSFPPVVWAPLEYPAHISKPSKALVETLYTEAMTDANSDQRHLNEAGILSFEDVLLPAIAFQEEKALKKAQSKVQRDAPDQANRLVAARKEVYGAIGAAVRSANFARQERDAAMKPLEGQLQEELAQQQKNELLLEEANAVKEKNDLRKKNPKSQELWREVAYLTTEKSKLEMEERMWKEVAAVLDTQEKELAQLEANKEAEDNRMDVEEAVPSQEIAGIEQLIGDITISSTRIKQALDTISNIVSESDSVRRELYRKYRQDHQFEGYKGVNDAKGLLRALSQSQDT